jgi:hypothetical protein
MIESSMLSWSVVIFIFLNILLISKNINEKKGD